MHDAGADSLVTHGRLLTDFVDAVLAGNGDIGAIRAGLRQALGQEGFVDACATLASFNAVVKLADGTGIPLEDWKEERTRDLREQLGIASYRASE